MSFVSDAAALGVAVTDVAWAIVLVLCGALMIWPFLFLYLAKRGGDPEAADPGSRRAR